jgi:hypothetical protein
MFFFVVLSSAFSNVDNNISGYSCVFDRKKKGREEKQRRVCFVKMLKREEREKEQTDETSPSRQKIEKKS